MTFHTRQEIDCILRRFPQGIAEPLERSDNCPLVGAEKAENEDIRMNGLDFKISKGFIREITQVHCYDNARAAMHRRRQNVPIIGIRQRDRLDQVLVAVDACVLKVHGHQLKRTLHSCQRNVRAISSKRRHPFIKDLR